MSIQAKPGTFLVQSTDTATTVIQVRGVGFTPKAIIFFASGRNEATNTAGRANGFLSYGVATGTANRACLLTSADDNVAAGSHATQHQIRSDACIGKNLIGGATDGLLDFNAFDADGFDVIVDDQFSVNLRVSYLAIGGDSITNATVNTWTTPTATGNFDVTNAGFQPDFILMGVSGATALSTNTATNCRGLGFATSSSARATHAGATVQGFSPTFARAYGYGGESSSVEDPGVNLSYRSDFVSFLSNGFRQNCLEANASAFQAFYLALQGGNYTVGNFNTRTDSNDIAISGLGYKPSGGILFSICRTQSTQNVDSADDNLTLGAFSSIADRVSHAFIDRNGQTTTAVSTAVYYDEAYVNIDNTGAVVGLMDVKSMDADGFTMVMDDTDPSAAFVGYAAFGPAAVTTLSLGALFTIPRRVAV